MSSVVKAVDLLTLLRLPGIGPRGAVRIAEEGMDGVADSEGWARARSEAENVLADADQLGVGVVGWFDEEFPPRLRSIPQAPAVVFYKGAIEVASAERSVAIVGTREPTSWGQTVTARIAGAFASDGWVIVSGLAVGVDTIAHKGALAGNTPTIAVLGNGLATVYPAVNRSLADDIVEAGGLLLAEVPPRTNVEPRALVKRDRLQSGLGRLTVISQGGIKSGAMHTARYAIEQERPLYCAALARDQEPVGAHDQGTLALLTEPGRRLPELLPPWKRAVARHLGDMPVARPLDESALIELSRFEPEARAAGTLF
jgi:DNA processing protein